MSNVSVSISTVSDGSMYNRTDPSDMDVIENRSAYLSRQGISIDASVRAKTSYDRADFCRYVAVDTSDNASGMYGDEAPIADALITQTVGQTLFLAVADCVGAVFFDPVQQVLMLSHLGRHSLEQEGAAKSVHHLVTHYQSNPKNILVWLTPAPSKEIYPIWALDNKGMKEATFEQLASAGILSENITDNPIETDKDTRYFSYSEFLKGHREDGDHAIIATIVA